jgi:DNA-directed RNA polymerase subunit M/transcription elongation factor TFIIS
MTLTCPNGHRDVELYDDNGAEYPETRVEFYECLRCGAKFQEVLTA